MSGKMRRTGSGNGKTSRKEKIMISYETWETYKKELANETWAAWAKWPADVQQVMSSIDYEHRECLHYDGRWLTHAGGFHPGTAYRVSPSWPGPAKPEPKPEYMDRPVVVTGGYRFAQPGEDDAHWLIAVANGLVGFCGYVYEIGGKEKIRPRLLFDQQPDGTYRPRIPRAVRFLKGAVA